MGRYDSYLSALRNSMYQDQMRQADEAQAQSGFRTGAKKAVGALVAPTMIPNSFGEAATLGSGLVPGTTSVGTPIASSLAPTLSASTAPITAPALGAGTSAVGGLTSATAPSLMTAGEIGAVGTAGEGLGASVASGLGASGIGALVGAGLAIGTAQPGSPLFKTREVSSDVMNRVESWGMNPDSLVGKIGKYVNPITYMNPQTYMDWMFGDAEDAKKKAEDTGRKAGLASALGGIGTVAKNLKSGGGSSFDPEA